MDNTADYVTYELLYNCFAFVKDIPNNCHGITVACATGKRVVLGVLNSLNSLSFIRVVSLIEN